MTDYPCEVTGPADLRELHRVNPTRYPFLLQSTATSDSLGRYDILFAFPGETIVAGGDRDFLDELDAHWQAERVPETLASLPYTGGWFVYLGYELAAEIEPALDLATDPLLPAAFAVRCPAALIFDHKLNRCHYLDETGSHEQHQAVLRDIGSLQRVAGPRRKSGIVEVKEETPVRFVGAVVQAKDHIAAGDIYQANLSRQWDATVAAELGASDIYDSLCMANPGPFAGMACWGTTEIISSSPERLLQVRDGIASTRPIAGTRPRSVDADIDDSLSAELFADPKERAEHVMLVDLERNDLGRVCEAGSVQVDEMMVLESYAHVHHIVSNVRGRLRKEVTPGQAIAAVFPGGTITGCPKVRCMQIISELEQGPRGAYTGSFGYLNRDGSLDLNILIRTMVKDGDRLAFRAGAGIVADSDPDAELAETRAKAEGMLRAIG